DGIENRLHPSDAMDENLYDLSPPHLKEVPTVSGSLRDACDALDGDRDFLKRGNVFSDDLIDAYLELKWDEVLEFETTTHPLEFLRHYSV
ncbi:MAG: glutamine synthetase, partial [Alphaproteobacteria bacterium]